MEILDTLAKELRKLPGIGTKSAQRIAFFLIQQDEEYLQHFGSLFSNLRKNLHTCSQCGNISEQDPCNICEDPIRDKNILCVVENVESLSAFEHAGIYNGLYHVLNTEKLSANIAPDPESDFASEIESYSDSISVDDNDKGLTEKDLDFFAAHVKALKPEEIIIATNPKIEGDMNYYTLLDSLRSIKGHNKIKITRLASGLPVGGLIEFADKLTLHTALRSRMKVDL